MISLDKFWFLLSLSSSQLFRILIHSAFPVIWFLVFIFLHSWELSFLQFVFGWIGEYWWLPLLMLVDLIISLLLMKLSLNLIDVFVFSRKKWVLAINPLPPPFPFSHLHSVTITMQVHDLPSFGIGHSLGSVIHLLIGNTNEVNVISLR